MRKISQAIVFALFAAAGNLCASAVSNPTSSALKISIAIPAASVSIDDLDVRDASNRPIRFSQKNAQFERLWVASLNQMLLNSLTPARLKLLALMNTMWDVFASSIRTVATSVWREIISWVQSQKQKLQFVSQQRSLSFTTVRSGPSHASGNSFLFLISFLISSTRLLR